MATVTVWTVITSNSDAPEVFGSREQAEEYARDDATCYIKRDEQPESFGEFLDMITEQTGDQYYLDEHTVEVN